MPEIISPYENLVAILGFKLKSYKMKWILLGESTETDVLQVIIM